MRTGFILIVTGLVFLFGQDAMAASRSMRCAGKLVKVGDFADDVVAKCGDPQHVETFEGHSGEWVSRYAEDDTGLFKAPYALSSPIDKEVWTYQPAPNRLPYYLYLYKGRLTRIEIGKKR